MLNTVQSLTGHCLNCQKQCTWHRTAYTIANSFIGSPTLLAEYGELDGRVQNCKDVFQRNLHRLLQGEFFSQAKRPYWLPTNTNTIKPLKALDKSPPEQIMLQCHSLLLNENKDFKKIYHISRLNLLQQLTENSQCKYLRFSVYVKFPTVTSQTTDHI